VEDITFKQDKEFAEFKKEDDEQSIPQHEIIFAFVFYLLHPSFHLKVHSKV
jgi:hypothetical protein